MGYNRIVEAIPDRLPAINECFTITLSLGGWDRTDMARVVTGRREFVVAVVGKDTEELLGEVCSEDMSRVRTPVRPVLKIGMGFVENV